MGYQGYKALFTVVCRFPEKNLTSDSARTQYQNSLSTEKVGSSACNDSHDHQQDHHQSCIRQLRTLAFTCAFLPWHQKQHHQSGHGQHVRQGIRERGKSPYIVKGDDEDDAKPHSHPK
ncbi:hypothetical protein [Gulbenkiania indica]|uniref:hypothetical protein n=1 Tax=Gulbenkiania indica TaxID=375574 RepID=UPI00147056B5|nr:hypothetical protein [Gulbenkiania indica]